VVPTPCHGQGHLPLDQVVQSSIQPGLEHCQGWACVCEHNCFIFEKSCNTALASPFEARKEQQNETKSHNKPQLFLLDPFLCESNSSSVSSGCQSDPAQTAKQYSLPSAWRPHRPSFWVPEVGGWLNVHTAFGSLPPCWKKTSPTTHRNIPLPSWGA